MYLSIANHFFHMCNRSHFSNCFSNNLKFKMFLGAFEFSIKIHLKEYKRIRNCEKYATATKTTSQTDFQRMTTKYCLYLRHYCHFNCLRSAKQKSCPVYIYFTALRGHNTMLWLVACVHQRVFQKIYASCLVSPTIQHRIY